MSINNSNDKTPINKDILVESEESFKNFSSEITPKSKRYYELLLVLSILAKIAKHAAILLVEKLLKILRGDALMDFETAIRSDPKLRGLADALYEKDDKK